ncbi:TRAP transporter small permease [Microbulbifer sp. S227A]|uniref:TRAP transporter small permease n=1 Tax=Microbulbifer sp. S227A TaxID=3415131 RepID=UPI003C7CACDB
MLNRLERLFVDVATVAIILLALLIFADVVALNLFNAAVPDTVIIVRELMVLAIAMPLAAATTKRAHIAVEFVTNFLPAGLVNWFVVFGSFFGVLALTPLIWSGGKELLHQWTTGSAFYGDLNLPQWPGRLAFVIGVTLCWLRLVAMVISDAATALRGEPIDIDGH